MLGGSEVKSLRLGRANIANSYAAEQGGEIFLINAYIPNISRPTAFNMRRAGPASCFCISARRTS